MAALLTATAFVACSSDDEIGDPIDIIQGYTLPQGNASAEANARIQSIYDKYGSYILYEFDDKDIFWTQITGIASSGASTYKYVKGDPADVDAMLDFLDDIWWKYFPESFLKGGGLPYRVFIVDSIYLEKDYGEWGIQKYPQNYYIVGKAIIIGNMGRVAEMSDYEKNTIKIDVLNALWTYYTSNDILGTPEEFYTISDYTTKPEMTYNPNTWSYYYTDEQLAALRNRGFIPNYSSYGYSVYSEIYMKYSESYDTWTNQDPKYYDYKYYLAQIFNATNEEAAEFLKYETVATKWNIILNYYKDNYGIDLRKIATE